MVWYHTTFSLFVTWNGIVPVLPVNKIYVYCVLWVHNSLCYKQHNSVTWSLHVNTMKVYREWRYSSTHFLNLGNGETEVAGFMDQPLHLPKSQMNRSLYGPQSWCGCFGEDINLSHLPEIETWFLGHPVHSLVTNLTELSHLPFIRYLVHSIAAQQVKEPPTFYWPWRLTLFSQTPYVIFMITLSFHLPLSQTMCFLHKYFKHLWMVPCMLHTFPSYQMNSVYYYNIKCIIRWVWTQVMKCTFTCFCSVISNTISCTETVCLA